MDFDTRRDCQEPGRLRRLEQASGIFFTGGNQLRLTTLLGGTPVAKLIRVRNAHGVTVGGTSAGASILSEHMIAFGDEGSAVISGSVRLAPGLGLTNRFIIDQHFRQRDRLGRLITALAYNPFAIGIGLDEDTAAFIGPDETVEVQGSGGVTIVDASEVSFSSIGEVSEGQPVCVLGLRLHILVAGATFNLHTRVASAGGLGRRQRLMTHQDCGALMRILDRSVYVGPSLYARFPVIRLELDLGALEAWPTGPAGRQNSSTRWPQHCRASRSMAAPIESPAAFFAACARTRVPGSGMFSSTSPSNCRILPAKRSPSAKRAAPDRPGVYTVVYEYAQRDEGIAAGDLGLRLLCSLLPAAIRPAGLRSRRLELAGSAR